MKSFGTEPSARDLRDAIPALKVIEAAIKGHHSVDVVYESPEHGIHTINGNPYGVRWNNAHHLVVWMHVKGEWEELRIERIKAATDTGDSFDPSPDWR